MKRENKGTSVDRGASGAVSRRSLLGAGAGGLSALAMLSAPSVAPAALSALSVSDYVSITQLNSRYFYALDGLLGRDSAAAWADTFTPDGIFYLLNPDRSVLMKATGTAELIAAYESFPDVATTRHWTSNLVIEPDPLGARSGCYILAMAIASAPATIARTGLYEDLLLKFREVWRFGTRTLILDPNSPPP